MLGYWQRPDLTADTIDDEGWLYTGDAGRLDDGFLFVTGRLKTVIVLPSGKNVQPEEVEEVLARSPIIGDVCVVGVAGPDGDEVVAVVTASEDAAADGEDAVRDAVRELGAGARRLQKTGARSGHPRRTAQDVDPEGPSRRGRRLARGRIPKRCTQTASSTRSGDRKVHVEESAAAGRLVSTAADLMEAGFRWHHMCEPTTTAYDLARAAVAQLADSATSSAASTPSSTRRACRSTATSATRRVRPRPADVKHLMDFPVSRLQADFGLDRRRRRRAEPAGVHGHARLPAPRPRPARRPSRRGTGSCA